jgi:carboxylate-amine ligase
LSRPEPTPESLRAAFDAPSGFTVGLEEEVMLLDRRTLGLLPRGPELRDRLRGDPRVQLELPAAQLELVVGPAATVPDAVAQLRAARADLRAALAGEAVAACAGVHPFAGLEGPLNGGPAYGPLGDEYAAAARRQLVSALQVHVAVRGADRALAVYESLRRHLPEVAALAANAPFQAGRDTGMASVRPLVCRMLPRQGVPPPLSGWDEYARELAWGARAGNVQPPGRWWWELRPHVLHGTLELRVPDAQTELEDAGAVAAFVQCLCAELAARHDAGERPAPVPTWRIEENRWSAARHGSRGTMADLETGRPEPTADRLHRLVDRLAGHAAELGCAGELARAHALVDEPGWHRQRAAARSGLHALVADLADRY